MDIRREILRNVILCQALEPLGKKPGLTSRIEDASPGAKLEYFIISGVNSSWAFYDLVDRILQRGQAAGAASSTRPTRRRPRASATGMGSKVNYGQILLLVPLVAAQALELPGDGEHRRRGGDPGADRRGPAPRPRARTSSTWRSSSSWGTSCRPGTASGSAASRSRRARRYFQRDYANVWESLPDYQHIHAVRGDGRGISAQPAGLPLPPAQPGRRPPAGSDMIYRLLVPEIGRRRRGRHDRAACT